MITVNEIMSTDLQTLSEGDTLADSLKLMAKSGIHHIPIVGTNDALVGLVTHRDVLAASDSDLNGTESTRDPGNIPVADFMTREVTSVDPRVNLRQAAIYLQQQHYGCLPVVDEQRLIGIVTDSDFVGLAINLLEQLEDRDGEDF